MSARILDGEAIAKSIKDKIARRTVDRVAEGHRAPGLAIILVGNDPSSQIYVRLKKKDCEVVGFRTEICLLDESAPENEVISAVQRFNRDENIDGILVQLPLPSQINALAVIKNIEPEKDVDGIHPYNLGMLTLREPAIRSCTSKGIMSLLDNTDVPIRGLDATVVGASNHVGRPTCLELLRAGCTVTSCHRFSRDTRSHVVNADIVVSATGVAGLIKGNWIKPGATVIDVGIERQSDGSLLGDVDFDSVIDVAGWLTPVPGGVGPMTRVSILENLMEAAEKALP
ncbi:MAG: bifunctional methylenetetrahydrofolate dehydrogenase/methenyltetrahydrofolate cyclohydrolase FolD [Pseudomonadota bacterium]|nr:bifunctional methylenetetrahydrofolate dehydrogenase/methenyltetrahydrofolate cyclohydrolase FolD [Pseudomonadota bacterium]